MVFCILTGSCGPRTVNGMIATPGLRSCAHTAEVRIARKRGIHQPWTILLPFNIGRASTAKSSKAFIISPFFGKNKLKQNQLFLYSSPCLRSQLIPLRTMPGS